LITEAFTFFAISWTEPPSEWRITIMSGFIASRFFAVSIRVSPLTMLLELAEMEIESALRRLAAMSKDTLVRVLGS
jgi:hypothetical protein